MPSITEHERMFSQALMLAITAPNKDLEKECLTIATELGQSLTKKQVELAKMGIETALEYMDN
tara:strand:- start:251 stop:439 length:189 start_codon:yes stop_codon:yes gene_type:complete